MCVYCDMRSECSDITVGFHSSKAPSHCLFALASYPEKLLKKCCSSPTHSPETNSNSLLSRFPHFYLLCYYCRLSGFRRAAVGVSVLLRYRAASVGDGSPTFRTAGCPKRRTAGRLTVEDVTTRMQPSGHIQRSKCVMMVLHWIRPSLKRRSRFLEKSVNNRSLMRLSNPEEWRSLVL